MMHLGLCLFLLLCGCAAYPLYRKIFNQWQPCSLIYAGILGLTLTTALTWWLALLGFKLSAGSALVALIVVAAINWGVYYRVTQRLPQRADWKTVLTLIFWFSVFSQTYLALRRYTPDILSLEKFPDLAFIFSIFRGGQVPPLDPFTAGETINYYYLGHFQSAMLSKVLQAYPNEFFHQHVSMAFGLTALALFAAGMRMFQIISGKNEQSLNWISGSVAALLGVISGNFQAFYETVILRNPKFWYPDATRYIEHTIHEYPSYSFIVGDLHGHVMNMPLAVCALALVLEWGQRLTKINIQQWKAFISQERILVATIGFAAAASYLINAWDVMTILVLAGFVSWWILGKQFQFFNKDVIYFLSVLSGLWIMITIVSFLPYWLTFSSPASGINLVPPAKSSPALQLAIIWFIHMYFSAVYLMYRRGFQGNMWPVAALSILGFFFIGFVEVAYFKDIYPEHFRANTMFKLGIQVWFWGSVVTAALITYILSGAAVLSKPARYFHMVMAGLILGSGVFWTIRAVPQGFALEAEHLVPGNMDGLDFMRKKDPSDLELIHWIRENVSGQPVIAEATGDSFSEHGRVSVYTGLPSVIQWPVHVWLWRGSYDRPFKPKSNLQKQSGQPDTVAVRVGDMQLLYETNDVELAKVILKKYKVQYVVVGRIERGRYAKISEAKFDQLGEIVFRNENTKLYKLH